MIQYIKVSASTHGFSTIIGVPRMLVNTAVNCLSESKSGFFPSRLPEPVPGLSITDSQGFRIQFSFSQYCCHPRLPCYLTQAGVGKKWQFHAFSKGISTKVNATFPKFELSPPVPFSRQISIALPTHESIISFQDFWTNLNFKWLACIPGKSLKKLNINDASIEVIRMNLRIFKKI